MYGSLSYVFPSSFRQEDIPDVAAEVEDDGGISITEYDDVDFAYEYPDGEAEDVDLGFHTSPEAAVAAEAEATAEAGDADSMDQLNRLLGALNPFNWSRNNVRIVLVYTRRPKASKKANPSQRPEVTMRRWRSRRFLRRR